LTDDAAAAMACSAASSAMADTARERRQSAWRAHAFLPVRSLRHATSPEALSKRESARDAACSTRARRVASHPPLGSRAKAAGSQCKHRRSAPLRPPRPQGPLARVLGHVALRHVAARVRLAPRRACERRLRLPCRPAAARSRPPPPAAAWARGCGPTSPSCTRRCPAGASLRRSRRAQPCFATWRALRCARRHRLTRPAATAGRSSTSTAPPPARSPSWCATKAQTRRFLSRMP